MQVNRKDYFTFDGAKTYNQPMTLEQRPVIMWHIIDGDFDYIAKDMNDILHDLLNRGRLINSYFLPKLKAYLIGKGIIADTFYNELIDEAALLRLIEEVRNATKPGN